MTKSYNFPVTVTGTVCDPVVFTGPEEGTWGDGTKCPMTLGWFEEAHQFVLQVRGRSDYTFTESEPKALTAKDLEDGEWYKFKDPKFGLSRNTYRRVHAGVSEVVELADESSLNRVGASVPWFGHENHPVVRVAKPEPEVSKPQVLPASSVPPVTVKREVLTIDKIGVGQTFIVHGRPDEVYVKISNSHVFNHKRLQMHTTVSERFKSHLNLVIVELVVYNGK